MRFQIFDVSHGFCGYLIADNGNVMLFDCGHNDRTGFRPSEYLPAKGCTAIEHMIIQNYDEDHISDLPNLRKVLPIQVLRRNRSLTPETIETIKKEVGPITSAMESTIDMARRYIYDVINPPIFPNIEYSTFHNSYPDFTDTNNLSVVSFIHYDGMTIISPGDLEKAGWLKLLELESFKNNLKKVNIFIASHHGREGGYCEKIFIYCFSDIIIISDKKRKHETQKNNYIKHANGVLWNGGTDKRYVLTTRSDGMITIDKQMGKGYHITTS